MFSKSNPFDESVIAATNENLTVENWELILAVTDRITRASPESARDCVASVEKRLLNKNPNVQLYAVALTEALVKNCDITVYREISSRSFTNTLTKLVHDKTIHAKVRTRILEFIQMCSFEFRAESSLGLMNEVYHSLRAEGIQFPSPQKPKKEFTQSELDKQKEEEEFQLALALSLSESENRPAYKSSAATPASTVTAAVKPAEETSPQISRVRALYDFQPTEQGELGFEKGDIIRVIESVYRDWWKGELRGKTGIFPVNYVEKIVDPSPSDLLKEASVENDVMNETRNIDRLLEMLSATDPRARDSFSDNEELQTLYNSTLSIRPKLVKLIEKYSLKKDELVALNEKFMQARTMYDGMLSNSIARYSSPSPAYGYPQQQQQQQQPQQQQSFGGYGYQQPQQQQQQPAAITSNPPPVAAAVANPSPSYGQQQQQPAYGYQHQPQQQAPPQQQSQAPPQSQPQQQPQSPQQQPAYSYNENPQYDYQNQYQSPQHQNTSPYNSNLQQQQSTPPIDQQQQQQQYATTQQQYIPPPPQQQQQQQQQQHQQNYSSYPTEGYPSYPSPGQQHQAYPQSSATGYNGHNY